MKTVDKKKSGQTILFLFIVILIGMVVVIWNFNIHRGVVMKMRMRDAGDAAALSSARWQGITLNMVGELNLIQAALVTETVAAGLPSRDDAGNPLLTITAQVYYMIGSELAQIHELRRRIALNGPLIGFAAAQQLVMNNRIHANGTYQGWYRDYADAIIGRSDEGTSGDDYGFLLGSIADNGIAARTIVTRDSHILLDPGFYAAIEAGKFENWWCAFVHNSEYQRWLTSYSSAEDWPELPKDGGYSILSLDVRHTTSSIDAFFENQTNNLGSVDDFESTVENINRDVDVDRISRVILRWATYGSSWYNSWQDFVWENHLPFRDDILKQYDYMGPESVFEINLDFHESDGDRPSSGEQNIATKTRGMRWISAAKPFGSLDQGGTSGQAWTPCHFGFVLPAFTDARLIPVQRAVYNAEVSLWHDTWHIPRLLEYGMSALDSDGNGTCDYGCSACQALIYFDDPSFRQRGMAWIEANQDICENYSDDGNGGGNNDKGPPFGH